MPEHARIQELHVRIAESNLFEPPCAPELSGNGSANERLEVLTVPRGRGVLARPEPRMVAAHVLGGEVLVTDEREEDSPEEELEAIAPVDELVTEHDAGVSGCRPTDDDHAYQIRERRPERRP